MNKLRTLGIVGMLAYCTVRFVVVKGLFESYGINPWLFLLIDCATSVTYVWGIDYLVRALSSKTKAAWPKVLLWAIVTIVSFAAPYVYLYAYGQSLPASLGVGGGVVVALLVLNAALSFVRRVRGQRQR